jgi:hypothetical protein
MWSMGDPPGPRSSSRGKLAKHTGPAALGEESRTPCKSGLHPHRGLGRGQGQQMGNPHERYMMIMLLGRFKGEVDLRWHLVPISNQTHSNIPFCLWMERVMARRVNYQHCSKGWLFKTRVGARAKFGKYNAMFRSLVALACATNSRLVSHAIKHDDFIVWRLPRQGAVLETTQRGVNSKVMELVNKWRSKESAKDLVPNLPMRQVYTEFRSTFPTMLKYSQAL